MRPPNENVASSTGKPDSITARAANSRSSATSRTSVAPASSSARVAAMAPAVRHSDSTDHHATTGDSFKRWIGKSVGEKFEDARDSMPPRDERSLPDQVYLDVITFILRFNKVPVGSQELKPDPAILKQIKISDPG